DSRDHPSICRQLIWYPPRNKNWQALCKGQDVRRSSYRIRECSTDPPRREHLMGAVNGTLETQNLIANGKKVCSVCKEWKPLGRYSADKRRSSGYQARCLDCQGKYQKKY